MPQASDISPAIVEGLYTEALQLADETRVAFDTSAQLSRARHTPTRQDEDLARVALSCEALRATTRMMHAIAWLLNQRAFLHGELSEFQLRRHGRLPPRHSDSETGQLALLPQPLRDLIEHTQAFYARIQRLDLAWNAPAPSAATAVHLMRERLGRALAG
ncbi:MAG: DUF1465 family protein [Croceibacterium sp.]